MISSHNSSQEKVNVIYFKYFCSFWFNYYYYFLERLKNNSTTNYLYGTFLYKYMLMTLDTF